jgi:uncharacterized PurR-regulated membrane protein YhhQ (DUF165 family)
MLDETNFMRISGYKNFIRSLVFLGLILATAVSFLFSMLLSYFPERQEAFSSTYP